MPQGVESHSAVTVDRIAEIDKSILRLVAAGRSSKEIAQELDRSPLTIDGRLKDVCARLGAENRVQAATMLLMSEAVTTPPDLGGPQSRRIAEGPDDASGAGEDGVVFDPASLASTPIGDLQSDLRLVLAMDGEGRTNGRSLYQVLRTVVIVLVGLACATFFLASAIEALQGVYHRAVGA